MDEKKREDREKRENDAQEKMQEEEKAKRIAKEVEAERKAKAVARKEREESERRKKEENDRKAQLEAEKKKADYSRQLVSENENNLISDIKDYIKNNYPSLIGMKQETREDTIFKHLLDKHFYLRLAFDASNWDKKILKALIFDLIREILRETMKNENKDPLVKKLSADADKMVTAALELAAML